MNKKLLKFFFISMVFSFLVIILIFGLITVEINSRVNVLDNIFYNLNNIILNKFLL